MSKPRVERRYERLFVKILVCGGGTGGHIYPALAAIDEMIAMGMQKEDFLWIGTQGEIEESLIPRQGLKIETITGGALVGVPWVEKVVNLTKLAWSLGKTSRIIRSFKPDVLFMTGGYVNAPVSLAAWMQRVPSVIYLPDIEPGLSIQQLSRIAERVACTAEESRRFFKRGKVVVTGYPIRRELRHTAAIPKAEALSKFNLKEELPTLFVFGGSRGARTINRALIAGLPELLQTIQVIHISGMLDWAEVKENRDSLSQERQAFYRAYPYLYDDMAMAFRAADIALARAGASMLGECPAFGLPSILVPYPHAWRYQAVNAAYLTERGAAITISDGELMDLLVNSVSDLISDKEQMKRMSDSAKALDNPESTTNLAELLIAVGERAVE